MKFGRGTVCVELKRWPYSLAHVAGESTGNAVGVAGCPPLGWGGWEWIKRKIAIKKKRVGRSWGVKNPLPVVG